MALGETSALPGLSFLEGLKIANQQHAGARGRLSIMHRLTVLLGFALISIFVLAQQKPMALKIFPNLETNIERPLRYRPEGADFVIENGDETFNRPLYGGNTAFRVDGGDTGPMSLVGIQLYRCGRYGIR
jgi:hypothetical protein